MAGEFHNVVCALLVRERHVLLVHRNSERAWAPDTWDAPGGHVEEGESDAEAMARELLEELGLSVPPEALVLVGRLTGADYDARVFQVTSFIGEPENNAVWEHDSIRWFTSGELPGLTLADPMLIPYLRQALGDEPSDTP